MIKKTYIRIVSRYSEEAGTYFDAELVEYEALSMGVRYTADEARYLAERLVELANQLDAQESEAQHGDE